MEYHAMFASGPFLTPKVVAGLLAGLGSPVLALVLLVVSIVLLTENIRGWGFLCLILCPIFLIPLLGFRTSSDDMLGYFGYSCILAVAVSLVYAIGFFICRKR
jgi:hypothetical protein